MIIVRSIFYSLFQLINLLYYYYNSKGRGNKTISYIEYFTLILNFNLIYLVVYDIIETKIYYMKYI